MPKILLFYLISYLPSSKYIGWLCAKRFTLWCTETVFKDKFWIFAHCVDYIFLQCANYIVADCFNYIFANFVNYIFSHWVNYIFANWVNYIFPPFCQLHFCTWSPPQGVFFLAAYHRERLSDADNMIFYFSFPYFLMFHRIVAAKRDYSKYQRKANIPFYFSHFQAREQLVMLILVQAIVIYTIWYFALPNHTICVQRYHTKSNMLLFYFSLNFWFFLSEFSLGHIKSCHRYKWAPFARDLHFTSAEMEKRRWHLQSKAVTLVGHPCVPLVGHWCYPGGKLV